MKTVIILITILTWNGEQRVSSSVATSMESCETMRLQLETPRADSEITAKAYCSVLRIYSK
jgi:hypothetical protein